MEIQALQTFLAVIDEGGVLAASKALHTVQSNVTSRIKRLEQELGTELFYRSGRGLELSPSGRELAKHARELIQMEKLASLAVKEVGYNRGEIRIGTMETFASYRLPLALKELRKAHPGIQIKIETNTSQTLINKVLQHKLDCAFIGGHYENPALSTDEVLVEELVLVRAKHDQNPDTPLMLFREGCTYRDRALQWQSLYGKQTQEILELGTLDGILGCVSVGLGLTLMPSWVVESSRFRDELIIERVPKSLALVPTLMICHQRETELAALTTLRQAVIGQGISKPHSVETQQSAVA
ncbi:LysR family transcriptional regulator [Sessilibacter sp. MAH2]